MSHTPEPWKVDGLNYPTDIYGSPDEKHIGPTLIATTKVEDFGYATAKVNAIRIVACVNGCAGLNPAAFRECVEALNQLQWAHGAKTLTGGITCQCAAHQAAKQALAHAQEAP